MTWLKLTKEALYLMKGGTNKYLEKVNLAELDNQEFKVNVPLQWFDGDDSDVPSNMILSLEPSEEPPPVPPEPDPLNQVISTKEWGARPPKRTPSRTNPKYIVIHHTNTPNPPDDRGDTEDGAEALARSIQDFHMDNRGWSDSGHNFLNTTGAYTLEGRHGSLEKIRNGYCVRSAHAPGANDSPGIENEGTFMSYQMESDQWNSLVELCVAICQSCELAPDQIKGHRDFTPTKCPGDWLYSKLPDLRKEVRAKLGNSQ
jgi:hypothetical protein